jgi:hypothetical protein
MEGKGGLCAAFSFGGHFMSKQKVRKRLDKVLLDFNKAICIVDTVLHALERVDHEPDVGSDIQTLSFGLKQLRTVHEALDLAILAIKK